MLASWLRVREYTHLAGCEVHPVPHNVGQLLRVRENTHLARCAVQPVPQNVGQLTVGQGVHWLGVRCSLFLRMLASWLRVSGWV